MNCNQKNIETAAASPVRVGESPDSQDGLNYGGYPVPPAAFFTIVKVLPQKEGEVDNLYCPITASNPSARGTEETLSDVRGGVQKQFRSEYAAWVGIRQRCHNPRYARYSDYGGRGIFVCERWRRSFQTFLADVGAKPAGGFTIERVDNNGPYSPDNCRWISYHDQTRNRRSNVFLTHNGITLCLNDWAERIGMGRMTLTQRLRRGWSVADALSTEVGGVKP